MSQAKDLPEDREQRMQKAFEELAESFDMKLGPPPEYANEPVGVLIACVPGLPMVEVPPPKEKASISITGKDDREIKRIVARWERASPKNVVKVWAKLAASTAIALTPKWLGGVNRKMVQEGIQSKSFKKQQKKRPPYDPRKVSIKGLRIVYVSKTQAVVTYRFKEEFQNHETYAANSVMILMRDAEQKWKVALYTKHTFNHDLELVED